MKMSQFFFELVVTLFLVIDVIFPVDQVQIGSLYAFLQLFGSLDGCFYLYVRFFLIYLFLQSRQLGLQHLILGFELIDLLGLCLTAPIFLAFVVYGKGIFVLGGVVECGRAGRLQFYPQLTVYFFELGDVELAGFDSECQRIVIFLFIEHVCQYEVSFIGL
jgi:hypothetical protein